MYFNILKKDLIRKKSMNLILLMFIILASTFASGSANNLVTILSAMDDFIEESELADYNIFLSDTPETVQTFEQFLQEEDSVSDYREYRMPLVTEKEITRKNGESFEYSSQLALTTISESPIRFWNRENQKITKVNDGEVYLTPLLMNECQIEEGETIVIKKGDYTKEFVVYESKNLLFGSVMMGISQIVLSENDYSEIENEELFSYVGYEIWTTDVEAFDENFAKSGILTIYSIPRSLMSLMYIMDMITAGVLLLVSVCLILISLVILRFTISFTLHEEFREIGVMKAIGIKNRKIRWIYCSKYFALSLIGSLLGFLLGIPFSQMLLSQVGNNIPIFTGGRYYINGICAGLVVLIIVIFCFLVTGKLRKFTPIDAIRSGTTGERYQKKGIIRLAKGNIKVIPFLACNDILSGIRKFSVMLLAFTLGIILIIIPVNTTNTLSSDKLVSWFAMVKSDVYMSNEAMFGEEGKPRADTEKVLSEIYEKLHESGIEADVYQEKVFKYNISFGEKSYNSLAFRGVNVTTEEYVYMDGTAPQSNHEVGITHMVSDKIGAKIGDTVKIMIEDEEQEFIVTAIFQTMNNMGEGIRFYQDLPLDYTEAFGEFGIQIRYTDKPTNAQKAERMETIKELFSGYKVYTGGEYINEMMGGINLNGLISIITAVVLVINALVAILMVRSFITKETGEIGMLKAIGFRNASIIHWQTLRIGIVLVISTIIGAVLSNLLAKPTVGLIFQMMGAYSIEFEVKPLEVYLLYPLLVFAVTMAASFLAAQQIRRISASETSNIE